MEISPEQKEFFNNAKQESFDYRNCLKPGMVRNSDQYNAQGELRERITFTVIEVFKHGFVLMCDDVKPLEDKYMIHIKTSDQTVIDANPITQHLPTVTYHVCYN
jgi:hypothetical protein